MCGNKQLVQKETTMPEDMTTPIIAGAGALFTAFTSALAALWKVSESRNAKLIASLEKDKEELNKRLAAIETNGVMGRLRALEEHLE